MCLRPVSIMNKTHGLSNHVTPLYMNVPCGSCPECARKKKTEYLFRAYYESMDCFKSGGYVYFDTLTYSDEHLPHVSDFIDKIIPGSLLDYPCFDYKHFRFFMNKLKVQLHRRGYDVKNNLRYFMSCEYGTNPNRTHRPHYHVLFFVKNAAIPALELSAAICNAWTKGRTDGINYQSSNYIWSHVFSNVNRNTYDNVIKYVAKYVNKDPLFQTEVTSRIRNVVDVMQEDFDTISEFEEFKKKVIKSIEPFHLNSSGFGSSFLDYNDIEDVNRNGTIRMPDSKGVMLEIPIPTYLKRKIWYELVTDADGQKRWKLNEEGLKHNQCYVSKCINALANEMQEYMYNLEHFPDLYLDAAGVHRTITGLMDNRSWYDYAVYQLLYSGRFCEDAVDYCSTHSLSSIDERIKEIYDNLFCFTRYSYNTNHDDDNLNMKFISRVNYGTFYDGYSSFEFFRPDDVVSSHGSYHEHVFSESMRPEWYYFDFIRKLYVKSLKERCKKKSKSELLKRKLEERYKQIGYIRPLVVDNPVVNELMLGFTNYILKGKKDDKSKLHSLSGTDTFQFPYL